VVYPKEHTHVYNRILERGGCILSEYAPGTEPKGEHFPVRNRIISGLSDAGVVVEGKTGSGSLITARHLIYQGRKLFAVPGQVGLPGSEGPNDLIRNGALPAVTAEDVLCEFEYMFPDTVRVHVTHNACRNLDVDKLSRETMQKNSVGTRKSNNFVGEGTYGGRNSVPSGVVPTDIPVPMPVENWVYTETAKAVEDTRAPGVAEPAAEQEEAKMPPMKKESILEKLSRSLANTQVHSGTEEQTAEKKKTTSKKKTETPKKRETEKSSQKDTEKIQPAQKMDTEMLDETEMRVYNSMKPNVPVTPDELVAAGGFSIGQVMAAMTALEMAGAIEAGSGGYFLRTDPDDMPVILVDDTELEENTVQ